MSEYKQGNRSMIVNTPLGPDVLILVGLEGTEELSTLFSFRLELIAKARTKIDFEKILGQNLHVSLRIFDTQASEEPRLRHFHGICRQFSQGNSDEHFTSYQADIVPQVWLTTRMARCRIFQQLSVPDILKKVLEDFNVEYVLDGKFEKRDYCVQYRETDFNFVSRLMEEEGIFYFFRHTAEGHEMVIANSPRVHTNVPGAAKVRWDAAMSSGRECNHVHEWVKRQEIRSGKYTLWDHSFAYPENPLKASKNTIESVVVGNAKQKLNVANNKSLEIYDYPGDYAKWFDGVDQDGNDQPEELSKIFEEKDRLAEIRIQAETCAGLRIHGVSNCRQFISGYKFNLDRHPDADGAYVLTSVHHRATGGNAYRTGRDEPFIYTNSFTCIPIGLPFRPPRVTPKPIITGAQTGTVVGPEGQEIFVDKHARVKVQFPWDREGDYDARSSCWMRVSQAWGGGGFGAVSIPRVGHEVIIEFMEGDPDRPIIIGRVYNAKNMPQAANAGRKTPGPASMKEAAMMTSMKSQSTPGGGGANEITMNDTKGAEGLHINAQHDEIHNVNHDREDTVGNNEVRKVANDRTREVTNNETVKVDNNRSMTVAVNHTEKVGSNQSITVGSNQSVSVGSNKTETVAIASAETVGAVKALSVGAGYQITVGASMNTSVALTQTEQVGLIKHTLVGTRYVINVGAASITIEASGKITIKGSEFEFSASGPVKINGSVVDIN